MQRARIRNPARVTALILESTSLGLSDPELRAERSKSDAELAEFIEREGITADEAAKRVDDTNKRREQYVRRYWQRSWHAPENYHLCVNTEWLGIADAADLIVKVAREHLT